MLVPVELTGHAPLVKFVLHFQRIITRVDMEAALQLAQVEVEHRRLLRQLVINVPVKIAPRR